VWWRFLLILCGRTLFWRPVFKSCVFGLDRQSVPLPSTYVTMSLVLKASLHAHITETEENLFPVSSFLRGIEWAKHTLRKHSCRPLWKKTTPPSTLAVRSDFRTGHYFVIRQQCARFVPHKNVWQSRDGVGRTNLYIFYSILTRLVAKTTQELKCEKLATRERKERGHSNLPCWVQMEMFLWVATFWACHFGPSLTTLLHYYRGKRCTEWASRFFKYWKL